MKKLRKSDLIMLSMQFDKKPKITSPAGRERTEIGKAQDAFGRIFNATSKKTETKTESVAHSESRLKVKKKFDNRKP